MTTNYRQQQNRSRNNRGQQGRPQNRSQNNRSQQGEEQDDQHITERVVRINRVAKVVKGGRHLSFNAVVVVGDGEGKVGIGMGKADAVPDAVRKGGVKARANMIEVPLSGSTIPHEIVWKYGGAQVMLKPAAPGTGVIAGGAIRAVVELAGVRDILTKSRRSNNPVNVVKATFEALKQMRLPEVELQKRRDLVQAIQDREQAEARRLAEAEAAERAAEAAAAAEAEAAAQAAEAEAAATESETADAEAEQEPASE